jgi:hypothetical protein
MRQSDQRYARNRMRAPVVGVDDIDVRVLNARPNSECRAKVPIAAHRKRLGLQPSGLGAMEKW